MKRYFCFAILFFLFLSAQTLFSQNVSFVMSDSLSTEFRTLISSSRSQLFHDPVAPKYTLVDENEKFAFELGGYVGIVGKDFIPSHSKLFARAICVTSLGKLETYIETDFNSENGGARLRRAYFDYLGFHIGRDYSLFTDNMAITMISPDGVASITDQLVPGISWRYHFKNNFNIAIAVEASNSVTSLVPKSVERGFNVENVPQSIPDIPVAMWWDFDRFHLYGAVNMRLMTYPEYESSFGKRFVYATLLSANVDLYKSNNSLHRLYLQGLYSFGMADCIGDFRSRGLNIVSSADGTVMSIVPMYGLYAGYQFCLGNNQVNLIYSRTQLLDIEELDGIDYSGGDYVSVNYLRRVVSRGHIGAEITYGNSHIDYAFILRYDF